MSEGHKAAGFGGMKSKDTGHIDLMYIIESMCRREEFRDLYHKDIRVRVFISTDNLFLLHTHTHTQDVCQMLSKDNAIPIAFLFTGKAPSPSLAYLRTREMCVGKLDVCEEDTTLEETYEKIPRKHRKCWLCHVIARDFVGTLQRYHTVDRKVSFRVLDELCSRIAIRYPKRVGLKLEVTTSLTLIFRTIFLPDLICIYTCSHNQEMCDEITEDDDKLSDIVDVVIARQHNCEELIQSFEELFCDDACYGKQKKTTEFESSINSWWWFRKGHGEVDYDANRDDFYDDGNETNDGNHREL
jgi:hypothetical protein